MLQHVIVIGFSVSFLYYTEQVQVPAAPLASQLSAHVSRKAAEHSPHSWAPATDMGGPHGFPGCQLQSDQAHVVVNFCT